MTIITVLTCEYLISTLWRRAEKFGSQDREKVDLFLQELQTQLRTELRTALQTGVVPRGLVKGVAAVQKSRAYTAANLNLRLLLEDLMLTLYEEQVETGRADNT